MKFSGLLLPALAFVASAAPAFPDLNLRDAAMPAEAVRAVSQYFNAIALRTQASKIMAQMPSCDVSKAKMPIAPSPLPAPALGLSVKAVEIGRGTQNYTCEAGNASAAPKAAGAVAALYDAGCVAAVYPELVEKIANMAVHFELKDIARMTNLASSGQHYFTNEMVPFFDLGDNVGRVPAGLNTSTPAPMTAAVGPKGEPAVPWLKLDAKDEVTGNIKSVYRVNTVGGAAPKTCENMPETFQVPYVAVYWFWAGDIIEPEE